MITGFKFIKEKSLIIFNLLLVVCLTLSQITFANDKVDINRMCSIELIYQDDGTPIAGATFQLYFVADVSEDEDLEMTDEFAPSGVDLDLDDSCDWPDDASTLHSYITLNGAKGHDVKIVAKGVTDEEGKVEFDNLETGVYLLTGEPEQVGGIEYDPVDTLVMLPSEQDGEPTYNVTVYPKEINKNVPTTNTNTTDNYIRLNVQKIWEDTGYESSRPDYVTVVLLRNGEVYGNAVLNKANNWRYMWDNLDENSTWELAEENVPSNYTVTSVRDGNTFVVTNKRTTTSHSGNGSSGTKRTETTTKTTEATTETTTKSTVEATTEAVTSGTPTDTVISHDNPTDSSEDEPEVTTDEDGTYGNDADRYRDSRDPNKPGDEDTPGEMSDNPTNNPKTPNDTTKTETLPQTGQLWWPIPLFLISGLILLMMGIRLRKTD
jgi:hypothetical protein